ncbi:hypothetical protein EYC08_09325 [Tabrizicola sp. WMC-M-20]|nr:hypothetical protein EYC08_09325 [Tabrizicola sp. WMC-M-20]
MPAALAALPILVVILAMAILSWRAKLAGMAGLCVALAVVLGGSGFSGAEVLVAGVAAEAASSTLLVKANVWPLLIVLT